MQNGLLSVMLCLSIQTEARFDLLNRIGVPVICFNAHLF
ncbi:Hypothetical protein OINT_1002206 [Brucella intermedia LMG 3301]|uniref:Uncharacterized protein n=2 Tax=Brucella intermedia TaxID=94625 RepID=U4VA54_9HYPH|nr:Hypothetical protein OINT_1002206 [Brucella intermedia LMG 3301]ERL99600.1 hypothetical protein Q644_10170 [Brucella intermedia 229E]